MNWKQIITSLVVLGMLAGLTLWLRSSSNRADSPSAGVAESSPVVFTVRPLVYRAHRAGAAYESNLSAGPRHTNVEIETALGAIQVETNPVKREALLCSAVDAVEFGEIPSAIDYLQNRTPCKSSDELSKRLVRRWAERDLQSATDWAGHLTDGTTRQDALNGVAIEWANQKPSEAADWARRLPGEMERSTSLCAIAYEFARTEPVESLRIAVELDSTPRRDELICHAAMEWAARDAASAVAWAGQIADNTLRQQVLAGVTTAWADYDPVSAATLAATNLPVGRLQNDAVVGIVERWVQMEPDAAARWVAQFPPGTLRQTAMENLTLLWPRQIPVSQGQ